MLGWPRRARSAETSFSNWCMLSSESYTPGLGMHFTAVSSGSRRTVAVAPSPSTGSACSSASEIGCGSGEGRGTEGSFEINVVSWAADWNVSLWLSKMCVNIKEVEDSLWTCCSDGRSTARMTSLALMQDVVRSPECTFKSSNKSARISRRRRWESRAFFDTRTTDVNAGARRLSRVNDVGVALYVRTVRAAADEEEEEEDVKDWYDEDVAERAETERGLRIVSVGICSCCDGVKCRG